MSSIKISRRAELDPRVETAQRLNYEPRRMAKRDTGHFILLAFLIFSLATSAFHAWLIFLAGHADRQAIYHVVSPILSMPYVFASLLLPLILARKIEQARKALTAVLAVFIVMGILWWTFASETPLPPEAVTFVGRLSWLVLLPLLWIGALHLPNVGHFINQTS